MNYFKRIITTACFSFILFGCGNSTHERNGELSIKDFLNSHTDLQLPAKTADSTLANFGDTTTVDLSTFSHFIPDSLITTAASSSNKKYVIRTSGIIHTKTTDYLLTKITSGKIIKLMVSVFDDKHQYKTSLELLNNQHINKYTYSLSITNEPTFIVRKEKLDANKDVLYSRTGYAYNDAAGVFAIVMNDSNEDTAQADIINPIDTLAQLNKFSGNYTIDKKDFISIRDGKNVNNYKFFIHFEKNDCIGELKGEMDLNSETNAVYQENGNPCMINFKFSKNSVTVKENGNCGNYRGITCPFDFTFKKKKALKIKQKNLKTHS